MHITLTNLQEQSAVAELGRVALPIQPENIFDFPDGLPAFEDAKKFVFLCRPDTSPFLFMRALEPADIGFVCIDPFLICPDYKPRISDADTSFLELKSPGEVLMLSIVTTSKDVRKTTANLQGPLAINVRTCRGKQVLCEGEGYPVRYRIWEALDRLAEREQRNNDAIKGEARRAPAAA